MERYRHLAPEEIPLARRLLEHLDADDLYHHFLRDMTARDLDAWQGRAEGHRLIGCFDEGVLIGFAEIAHAAQHAECSLCVAPGYRRRGIGTVLFEGACRVARADGAEALMVLVSRGDAVMLEMAAGHDGISLYRHGRSLILPGDDHPMARWLVFDLDLPESPEGASADWFSRAVRSVRDAFGL